MTDMPAFPLLQMRGVQVSYGSIPALRGADFDLYRGEIHALVGAHRAGKSSLVKLLSGAVRKEAGEILFDGRRVDSFTPRSALRGGIGMVYQHLNVIPSLSAAENIFAGRLLEIGPDPPEPPQDERGGGGDLRPSLVPRRRGHPRGQAHRGGAAHGGARPSALLRSAHPHPRRGLEQAHPRGNGADLPSPARAARSGQERDLHLAQHGRDLPVRRPGHDPQGRANDGHGAHRGAGQDQADQAHLLLRPEPGGAGPAEPRAVQPQAVQREHHQEHPRRCGHPERAAGAIYLTNYAATKILELDEGRWRASPSARSCARSISPTSDASCSASRPAASCS